LKTSKTCIEGIEKSTVLISSAEMYFHRKPKYNKKSGRKKDTSIEKNRRK
jgi:hypothetical protein